MIFLGVQSEILYLYYFKRYKLLKKSLQTRADRQLDASTLFLLPPLPSLLAVSPARQNQRACCNVLRCERLWVGYDKKQLLKKWILTRSMKNMRTREKKSAETQGNYKMWGSESPTYTSPPLRRFELEISSIARRVKFHFCLEVPFSRIASHI